MLAGTECTFPPQRYHLLHLLANNTGPIAVNNAARTSAPLIRAALQSGGALFQKVLPTAFNRVYLSRACRRLRRRREWGHLTPHPGRETQPSGHRATPEPQSQCVFCHFRDTGMIFSPENTLFAEGRSEGLYAVAPTDSIQRNNRSNLSKVHRENVTFQTGQTAVNTDPIGQLCMSFPQLDSSKQM